MWAGGRECEIDREIVSSESEMDRWGVAGINVNL